MTSSPESHVPLMESSDDNNNELNSTLDDLYPYWRYMDNKPWLDVENVDDCGRLFEDFKRLSRDHRGYRDLGEQTTEEFVSKIFVNGTYNYSTNINHTKCVAMETEVLQLIEEPLVEAKMAWEIYLNLTTADTIQETLAYAERLTGYYGDIVDNGLIRHKYYIEMYDQCDWIHEFIRREINRVDRSKQREGEEIRKNVRKILDTLRRGYWKMYENYMTMILLKIENLDKYLHGNMTKTELSENLSETSFVKSAEALYGRNTDIFSFIKEYVTEMTLAKENLFGIYRVLVSLKLPILNTHNVYELELVTQSDSLNDSRLQKIVDGLGSNVTYLPELVAECLNRLIQSMDEITAGLVKPIEDMLEKLDELRNDLEIYQRSTRMDTDFFMNNFIQLDIFYQELSYEEIEQNIPFEFLSLLSEIGGFLGLLLGASILTVCELIDYLILVLIRKCSTKIEPSK